MTTPIWKYLSIKIDVNDSVQFDTQSLKKIRDEFDAIYGDQDRDDDDLKNEYIEKLINELGLINDQMSKNYLDKCISEAEEEVEGEIKGKVRSDLKMLKLIPRDAPQPHASISSQNSSNLTKPSTQVEQKNFISLDKIICIVHQKSIKTEVNDFLCQFLFEQVNQKSSASSHSNVTHPICDGVSHPLSRGSLLDLFIRRQMMDRGIVTSIHQQTKYRLVEPISLTDEFDSWKFDHFRGLLDFWLVMDIKMEEAFPNPWILNTNANIEYIIVSHVSGAADDDRSVKHSERPSTKSLENFLRDICQNEGNGMSEIWCKALNTEENITTYEHLTNLNQKEWDRIARLPMNALKTIRFYVNQEKQMTEERKTKKIPEQKPTDDGSYSKAEIRANLHMIKLYFNRQLEYEDGIKTIPKLDSYCVREAFEEMREEGYEEDGLFKEMELFFQALTVKEEELIINKDILSKQHQNDIDKRECLQTNIVKLKEQFDKKNDQVIKLSKEIEEMKAKRHKMFTEYESASEAEENRSILVHMKLRDTWSANDDQLREEINSAGEKLAEYERELQKIENDRISDENSLNDIDKNLSSKKVMIDRRLVKHHRGFIMYGPPGTGKSVIMSQLAKKIGIAMLGPPLAAGELERPLVGQSEAIILDLCMRGNRLPHLICCVSIDEIDSLAPKRDEDSSEGKVAKISVLLSVIEGIKDVPNLMFFSATNRLHMMDEAFLRRMSGKFFVGRPSASARKRILDKIPRIILEADIREKLAVATTNFSGAALRSLTGAITVHYLSQRRPKEDRQMSEEEILALASYEMSEEETLVLADRTARQYQLYLGLDTLPRLFLHNLDNQRQLSKMNNQTQQKRPERFHLRDDCRFTGKIIISLQDKSVRMEILRENNERHVIEDELSDTEQNLQQLLERISFYGKDRNVQLLQLIDLNLLSSKGAYEEKKIFELLKERYDECMEYKRSMIIYDLDSLIGVSRNESESSMGTSVTSSVVNQNIYIYVTSRFREAKIETNLADEKSTIERWAIAVVRDRFLLKKFTADVDFTLTEKQVKEEEEEHQRATEILICVKCQEHYIENENKMGACHYHDGFVYDNLAADLPKHKPSDAIEILNEEEYISHSDKSRKEEIDRGKGRFKYICCHGILQIGAGVRGCKTGKHGFEKIKKVNQRADAAEKGAVDQWETVCYDNVEYTKRLAALIKKRGKPYSGQDAVSNQ